MINIAVSFALMAVTSAFMLYIEASPDMQVGASLMVGGAVLFISGITA